jgi:hypothetical protein
MGRSVVLQKKKRNALQKYQRSIKQYQTIIPASDPKQRGGVGR